ncbi:MAG: transporter substrate-binding domain-containing protein [Pirellulales bacterium]
MKLISGWRAGLLAALLLVPAGRGGAEELEIAFTLDTPPFVMDDATRGIEIDIVRAALEPRGYTFSVRQMPYGELPTAVTKHGLDAAATVVRADDGTYYSDNYVTFRNAAITKRATGIEINSIADLKGKSILAWQNAYEDLGPEFAALFSPDVKAPYRAKYREIADQREQVAMFWKGEADVIVIDDTIMQWFTNELSDTLDTSAPLDRHQIFAAKTPFRISFKSEQVRDDFNAGLKQLRESGAYQKIYEKYLQ